LNFFNTNPMHSTRPDKSPMILVVIGCSIATTAIGGGGYWWWRNVAAPGERPGGSLAAGDHHAALGVVTLIVSGDTAGWIVPCGCTSNQSGGLPRRGTFVSERRREGPVIVADAGGVPDGFFAYQRARFEAILDGEVAMGIEAHNLGGPEIRLGVDYLRGLAAGKGIPFVSANLRDWSGRLVVDPYRIVEAGGVRVLLIGVARVYGGGIPAAGGWREDDPRNAVLKSLDDAAGKFDRTVVLAHLNEADLLELAAALPEVDAVIGGPTGQSLAPTRVGQVVVASATNKGKFVISLPLTADRRQQAPPAEVVELTDRFQDDPAQLDLVRSFRKELGFRNFTADKTGFAPYAGFPSSPALQQIAGTDACRECHADEFAVWDESKHAQAWQTLLSDGVHVDPACQWCHTTGYGYPGGFQSVAQSAARVAVGCESCHGPSQAHVERPKQRTPFVAREQCTRCHDHENSPQFEFETYWKQVAHGKHSQE
jgi:hypothetical protein